MNRENISEFIEANQCEEDKDTVLIDGHESAFVGYIRNEDGVSAVYSYEKILENLTKDGMSYEDAVEFFDYNIERGIDYITKGVKPTILYTYNA
jgi:hypothetical protein